MTLVRDKVFYKNRAQQVKTVRALLREAFEPPFFSVVEKNATWLVCPLLVIRLNDVLAEAANINGLDTTSDPRPSLKWHGTRIVPDGSRKMDADRLPALLGEHTNLVVGEVVPRLTLGHPTCIRIGDAFVELFSDDVSLYGIPAASARLLREAGADRWCVTDQSLVAYDKWGDVVGVVSRYNLEEAR